MRLSLKLEDPLICKLTDLWIKVLNNSYDEEQRQGVTIVHRCVEAYGTFYVLQSDSTTFYNDTTKTPKRFRKNVGARFECFKQFLKQNLARSSELLMTLLEKLQAMEFDVRNGSL